MFLKHHVVDYRLFKTLFKTKISADYQVSRNKSVFQIDLQDFCLMLSHFQTKKGFSTFHNFGVILLEINHQGRGHQVLFHQNQYMALIHTIVRSHNPYCAFPAKCMKSKIFSNYGEAIH